MGGNQIGVEIAGWGKNLPQKVVKSSEIQKNINRHLPDEKKKDLDWIANHVGINQRHIASGDETVATMGAEAAKRALAKANHDPKDVDLIVCATSTPRNEFPASANIIQGLIEATNAVSHNLSAACTGFVFGVRDAYANIKSGLARNALVIGSEVMSKAVNWDKRGSSAVFGDGAGAVLLRATDLDKNQIKAFYTKSMPDQDADILVLARPPRFQYPFTEEHASKLADQADLSPQRSGSVFMQGRVVYNFAIEKMQESILAICNQMGIKPEDVDFVVPHQSNNQMITKAAENLGIGRERFVTNLKTVGNTSAASIPIAVAEAQNNGVFEKAKAAKINKTANPNAKLNLIYVGYGAGFNWGAFGAQI